jgi:hypothetical protein
MMNKKQYQDYLQGGHWRRRREQRLTAAENRCEFRPCDDSRPDMGLFYGDRCSEVKRLEVHHRHYNTLGAESDKDLEVLCRVHHLVREIEAAECERCTESVVGHEEDAVAIVEATIELYGTRNLTLDEIDVPDFCDYCDHVLTKDD